MAYDAEISRRNPSCFLFLIDQSGSMVDVIAGGHGKTKCEVVAETINRLLQTISIRCSKDEGVWDYFDIGVIDYKEPMGKGKLVGPAFAGSLAGRDLVPISEVATNPKEVKEITKRDYDDAGGVITKNIKLPIWFEPVAEGGTPMCEALRRAYQVLSDWVGSHPDSYPPIVINITDGEANDGDPLPEAEKIKGLGTNDGNVLILNCHISSKAGDTVIFPNSEAELPNDKAASDLFKMSSELPPQMLEEANKEGFTAGEHARGFAFNADLVNLVMFLQIGTRPSPLR